MERYSVHLAGLFFLFIALFPKEAAGQTIEGDTVYVNTNIEVQIILPSEIDAIRCIPIETNKDIAYHVIDKNNVLLHALIEHSKNVIMMVKEADGGREHRFIIIYKKNINQYDFREYTYNYKTLKLLKKHIEETLARNSTASAGGNKSSTKPPEVKLADNSMDYYTMLEKGSEAFKKEAFEEAIAIYEKAKLLKPGDDIAQIKIDQARLKLGEATKKEQEENEQIFNSLKNEARGYLAERKYEKAKEAFEKAKYIMPGDGYAIRQIENINKLIAREAEQRKAQELLNQYNNFMTAGEKALNENKLVEATTAFSNALSVKQYDKKALGRLATIDELKRQQEINEELERQYKDALGVADTLFGKGDYNHAINEYNNALRIFPRSYPRDRIKTLTKIVSDRIKEVNRILTDQRTREIEKQRILALQRDTSDKYVAVINKASLELKKNNYLGAKNFYKQAAALKPLDSLPVSQLDRIEIKLKQIAFEKRKREDSLKQVKEDDKNYQLILAQAKDYYLKEDLLEAKIAYEAASDLKPLKEEPKKQLTVINNQLIQIQKERELDDRFDSITGIGDSLLILKQYEPAAVYYKAALEVKPAALYPTNQLRYIRSEIKYLKEREAIRKINEEEKKRFEAIDKKIKEEVKFLAAQRTGDSAVAAKNWAEAIKAFNEALSIHPDNKYIQARLRPVQYQYEQQKLAEQKEAEQKKEEEKSAKEKKKNKRKKNKDVQEPGSRS